MPTPKKCMNLHCDKRPICHTDYKPHYTEGFNLSGLIVGNRSWTYDEGKFHSFSCPWKLISNLQFLLDTSSAELSDWSNKYGYLDTKPMFLAEGESQGEIHVKITVGKSDFVLLCGTVKVIIKVVRKVSFQNFQNFPLIYIFTVFISLINLQFYLPLLRIPCVMLYFI